MQNHWLSSHIYITAIFQSKLSGESLPSLLDTIPIAPKANLVEESRPHPGTQPLDRPLKIHGSSIYGLSIVV